MTEEQTLSSEDQAHKIQSLRDMINSAEKTIQGARAILLQIEGKKKAGRRRKVDDSNGEVVEGVFDGQTMVGTDGKQYPVPANYASKSKLIQGDVMKLTITLDGSFIYKQIGPVARRHAIGIISQDERGNFCVVAEGKTYKVLLASVTYFHAEPGDEVAVILSQEEDIDWTAIDSVLTSHAQSPVSAQSRAKRVPSKPAVEPEVIPEPIKTGPLLPPTNFFTQKSTTTTDTPEAPNKVSSSWSSEILNIEDELQKETV